MAVGKTNEGESLPAKPSRASSSQSTAFSQTRCTLARRRARWYLAWRNPCRWTSVELAPYVELLSGAIQERGERGGLAAASTAGSKTYLSMTTAGVWFAMIAKGAGSTGTSSQSRDGEASRSLEAEERSNGPSTAGPLESRDRWGDADVDTEYVTCLEWLGRLRLQRHDR